MKTGQIYYLLGCGGHARSVADVIYSNNPKSKIIFIDENAKPNEVILGYSVVKEFSKDGNAFIPAVGDNQKRKKIAQNKKLISVISKTASVSSFSSIGEGCFIAKGAHIGPETHIGNGTIVNTNAIVEHNVQIGEFCHLAPNSTICGECKIGDGVLVGAGAIVKQCITIADYVVIGAGAVVVSDLLEAGIYVGCPARKKGEK